LSRNQCAGAQQQAQLRAHFVVRQRQQVTHKSGRQQQQNRAHKLRVIVARSKSRRAIQEDESQTPTRVLTIVVETKRLQVGGYLERELCGCVHNRKAVMH
jgi:hypothetical protein